MKNGYNAGWLGPVAPFFSQNCWLLVRVYQFEGGLLHTGDVLVGDWVLWLVPLTPVLPCVTSG